MCVQQQQLQQQCQHHESHESQEAQNLPTDENQLDNSSENKNKEDFCCQCQISQDQQAKIAEEEIKHMLKDAEDVVTEMKDGCTQVEEEYFINSRYKDQQPNNQP